MLIFSLSTVQAEDFNQTNHDAVSFVDDDVIHLENQSIVGDVESDDGGIVKNSTELSSKSTSISYKGSYSIVLRDTNSSALVSNRTVKFSINNVDYNATTDDNGVASVKLDLGIGKYSANTYFEGDGQYQNSSLSETIEIKSPIKANDIT